jgi:hypothetical protein
MSLPCILEDTIADTEKMICIPKDNSSRGKDLRKIPAEAKHRKKLILACKGNP